MGLTTDRKQQDTIDRLLQELADTKHELGLYRLQEDERTQYCGELAGELIEAMPFLIGVNAGGQRRCNCSGCVIHRGIRALLAAHSLDTESRQLRDIGSRLRFVGALEASR